MQSAATNQRQSVEEASSLATGGIADGNIVAGRVEHTLALCEAMIDITAALFNVCGKELRRPGRTSLGVARVRQIAMYVTHVVLGLPMSDIGRGFGRDRTTVLYACHLVEDLRDDEDFDKIVARTEKVAAAAFGAWRRQS